jgi:hypothetical protein
VHTNPHQRRPRGLGVAKGDLCLNVELKSQAQQHLRCGDGRGTIERVLEQEVCVEFESVDWTADKE